MNWNAWNERIDMEWIEMKELKCKNWTPPYSLLETTTFSSKIDGFRFRFPLKPIHWSFESWTQEAKFLEPEEFAGFQESQATRFCVLLIDPGNLSRKDSRCVMEGGTKLGILSMLFFYIFIYQYINIYIYMYIYIELHIYI